jgi:hypothetical protein
VSEIFSSETKQGQNGWSNDGAVIYEVSQIKKTSLPNGSSASEAKAK